MTINDINKLGERVLINYPLNKTYKVLKVLESMDWMNIRDNNLRENEGFYSRLLDIIDQKITDGYFKELKKNDNKKNYLLLRILRIRTSISQYRLLSLRSNIENNISQQGENTINDFEKSMQDKVDNVMQEIEPHLITIVLTLMGVFSVIITIIMSVVITSSSWLNNSNGASAVVAFIVPNLVVVSSMSVLLGIVFCNKHYITIIHDTYNSTEKKAKRFLICTVCFIFATFIVIVSLSLYEVKSSGKQHLRYILSQGMYKCIEVLNDETNEKERVIEFEVNKTNYILPYDESYFHDGKLYFCAEHNKLE